METNIKNILQNIIFYAFIFQSSYVLSSGGLPNCFQANKKRALPSLPQTEEGKKIKQQAFNNLLEEADNLDLTAILSLHKNIRLKESNTDASIESPISEQPPATMYASIEYYQRFSPQPNNANQLIIINDGIPQTFLKSYNQEEPPIELTLYPADISLLQHIHSDAKRITEDPLSFIIRIDDQSYGIQYLTFNNDCRSLGEQIKDITPIKTSDYTPYSLIIDENNMVTLKDTIINQSLLLRCTEFQFNHINTTELQFFIDVLDSQYAITSINNNGMIKELLAKKELTYEPLRSNVPPKGESTEEEKEKYRKFKEQFGLTTTTTSTHSVPATHQPEEQKLVIPQRWLFIGGIGASIVAITTLIYFFLATYSQHQ